MHVDWLSVREMGRYLYRRAAELYLFLSFCLYIFACIAGHGLLSPASFVFFVAHAFQWR